MIPLCYQCFLFVTNLSSGLPMFLLRYQCILYMSITDQDFLREFYSGKMTYKPCKDYFYKGLKLAYLGFTFCLINDWDLCCVPSSSFVYHCCPPYVYLQRKLRWEIIYDCHSAVYNCLYVVLFITMLFFYIG